MNKPKIVVVMPAYNEAENIGRMIQELVGTEFKKIKKAHMSLLVVDDYSPDGTGDIVQKYIKKYKNVFLLQKKKEGLGWAYVKGFQYAIKNLQADAVIEMDADFQHDPKHVKDLVKAYLNGADYVIGSRYVKGGSIPEGWEIHRKLISFLGNLFARVVLILPNLHDTTTGFRLTKVRGLLDQIQLENLMELNRFAYKVDLFFKTVKKAKNVKEVPIHFAQRVKEKSKFNLKEMLSTYKVVVKLRLDDSRHFIKFAVVGVVGYIINAVGLEFFYRVMNLSTGISASLGAEVAIISNFTLNNFWTFKENTIIKTNKILIKFFQFNLSSFGAVIIQGIVVAVGTHLIGTQYRQLILALAVMFFIVPYNYFMYNVFIWKRWKIPLLSKLQKIIG